MHKEKWADRSEELKLWKVARKFWVRDVGNDGECMYQNF